MQIPTTALDLSKPVELIVSSVSLKAARCRLLSSDAEVSLRAPRLWHVFPGAIVSVRPNKHWSHSGHSYLSGEIESVRLKADELGLIPLKLVNEGIWDPAEEYWGEEGEPLDERIRSIISRGRRPQFEMEQVLPGRNLDDADPDDPIIQAVECEEAGDREGAHDILMDLCKADLRCLDAHAHLGNLEFDLLPQDAIRHYEVGFRIGELSLGKDFDGVLPWRMIDNRPFLRCMNGFGLCLWRLEQFDEARNIFERILWLNPSDNQGVRFLIDEVAAKIAWKDNTN